jgi:glycosyltransferase involved in cell wall biosynthesis
MKIGVLTTSYPRHDGDYAGCFVGDRVQGLLAAGHAVDVLAAGDAAAAIGATARDGDLSVTRVAAEPALFYGAGAPEALERGGAAAWLAAARFSTALAVSAATRRGGWDAIEAHWLVPCALAAQAAAPAHHTRAYVHSGDVALLERMPLGRALARRLARGHVDFRFVSDELRARFASLAGTDPTLGTVEPLAPPASSAWSRRQIADPVLRQELGLRRPTVLAIGRLVPIKGHDRLLRACARLDSTAGGAAAPVVDAVDAIDVVILGDGPERERLARLAAELGVSLRLPGFVPRGDVARWLRAADVYVQPSIRLGNGRGEGAPLATAEARAVGLPVIVDSDPVALRAAIAAHLPHPHGRVHAPDTAV